MLRSQPVRIFSVTGTSTAPTTASRMRPTSGSSFSSAEPAITLQTFLAGQPMLMSMICAPCVDVVARRFRHHRRVRARDLHRDRIDFAFVIGAAARLFRAPQQRIARHHLGHRHAGAHALAQLPERAIGHARHRRDDQIVFENVGTDLHDFSLTETPAAASWAGIKQPHFKQETANASETSLCARLIAYSLTPVAGHSGACRRLSSRKNSCQREAYLYGTPKDRCNFLQLDNN